MKVKRVKSIPNEINIERLNAELEKEKAKSEYIAMMADIDIPDESEESTDE